MLVALAAGLQLLDHRLEPYPRAYPWMASLLFGCVGVLVMMTPVHFAPGVIYDGRSIVLSLAGLFCGPAAVTSAILCSAYRLYLGGYGAPVGVAVIVEATVLGIVLYYLRRRDPRWTSFTRLLAFGVLTHVIMLALQFLIPNIVWNDLLTRIAPGVLLFFPLAFVLTAHFYLAGEARRATERALTETDEWLKLSMNGAELGAWDWNVATGEIGFNDRWINMLGYQVTEITPRFDSWKELIHPDDRPHAVATLNAHLAGMTAAFEAEYRLRHKSGSWVWVLDKGRVIEWDARGNPLRACGTHLDITARRTAEEALRVSEARNRAIVAALPDMLFRISRNAEFLDYNALDPSELAIVPEDFIGKRVAEVLSPELADLTVLMLERTLETKEMHLFEYSFEIRGEDRKYEARMVPCDQDEVLVIARDITESKQIEAERERLLIAIEQSDETIMITAADGTIRYVNPAFERVSGYSREEAIGQNLRSFKSSDLNEAPYAAMWAQLTKGESWKGTLVNQRKGGAQYIEEVTISPVFSRNGEIVNYVAVKREISKRLELEHQLRQSQKMESVGRLAGGIAHDFNNMLNVILGCTDLVMEDIGKDHPNYADLVEVRDAAQRSAELTHQLLAFARKQPMAPRVLQLTDAVASLLKMLGRLIGEDIELVFNPGEDMPSVKIDPAQLGQVLANLVVNARDAIAGNGRITIETRYAILDEAWCAERVGFSPGHFAQLRVEDTGSGMTPDVLAQIFDPFFTTKPVGEGTGLGLATVYGIVKQNEAYIDVESTPGEGTTFNLYFPFAAPVQAKAGAATGPKKLQEVPPASETILVAEDDLGLLQLTQRLLEKQGYQVLPASSPSEAIRLARDYPDPIHLLLTDVIMPEMNGQSLFEATSQLRPRMKCLFMSGYSAEIIAHRGVLKESIHFLAKPFTAGELALQLRKVLHPEHEE